MYTKYKSMVAAFLSTVAAIVLMFSSSALAVIPESGGGSSSTTGTNSTTSSATCTGSEAPAGTDCSTIPLGCPGTTAKGAAPTTGIIVCPYSPSGSFTCPSSGGCVYQDSCRADSAAICNGSDPNNPNVTDPAANCNSDGTNCGSSAGATNIVVTYVDRAIALLSAVAGLAAAASLIYSGIQYSSAGGDPQKVGAAKGRIAKTIGALVAYAFLFGFLQFLIPGGLFNR